MTSALARGFLHVVESDERRSAIEQLVGQHPVDAARQGVGRVVVPIRPRRRELGAELRHGVGAGLVDGALERPPDQDQGSARLAVEKRGDRADERLAGERDRRLGRIGKHARAV